MVCREKSFLVLAFFGAIGAMLSARPVQAVEAEVKRGEQVITVYRAPLKILTRTLFTVEAGTILPVVDVKDKWIGVRVQQDGEKVTGWIHRRYVGGNECWKKVTTVHPAPLKVKRETLLRVEAGTHLVPLDIKGNWVAFKVQQGDKKISGWIHARYLASNNCWKAYRDGRRRKKTPEWANRMGEIEKTIVRAGGRWSGFTRGRSYGGYDPSTAWWGAQMGTQWHPPPPPRIDMSPPYIPPPTPPRAIYP